MKTGEIERANALLDGSREVLAGISRLGPGGFGITDVQIDALQGNNVQALAKLREAVDLGWRRGWWFTFNHAATLDSLHEEPAFIRIRDELAADMSEQRARVRALEAAE